MQFYPIINLRSDTGVKNLDKKQQDFIILFRIIEIWQSQKSALYSEENQFSKLATLNLKFQPHFEGKKYKQAFYPETNRATLHYCRAKKKRRLSIRTLPNFLW